MLEFLWDLDQQRRINEVDARTTRTVGDAQQTQRRVVDLEARVDALVLACTTMWSLLQSKVGITEQEFAARLRDIDLRDGTLDGRIAPEVKACAACGRTMSSRHARCMYCGDANLSRKPFEGAR